MINKVKNRQYEMMPNPDTLIIKLKLQSNGGRNGGRKRWTKSFTKTVVEGLRLFGRCSKLYIRTSNKNAIVNM